MRRLKFSLAALLLALAGLAAYAQTAAQIESDEVKRVGRHLGCQCGSCQEDLNCNMSSGQCHFCKPARTRIYTMQREGKSDAEIIQAFVAEYGKKILRADPNSFFWLIPYLLLVVGGVGVWILLKKMRGPGAMKPAAASGPAIDSDDPVLAKYRDAIERDTERLE